MQSKENIAVDARTFPEIWESLNTDEQSNLRADLLGSKCCTTRQCIHYWAKGEKSPNMPIVRNAVAKVVGKFLGKKVFAATLFPV